MLKKSCLFSRNLCSFLTLKPPYGVKTDPSRISMCAIMSILVENKFPPRSLFVYLSYNFLYDFKEIGSLLIDLSSKVYAWSIGVKTDPSIFSKQTKFLEYDVPVSQNYCTNFCAIIMSNDDIKTSSR